MLPLLPVPLALLALAVLRPGLLTSGAGSPVALATGAGVAAAGLLVLLLVGRRRSRAAGLWAADVVVLALVAAVVWPAFRERTVVEDFPPVAAAAPVAASTPELTLVPGRVAPTVGTSDQAPARAGTTRRPAPATRPDTRVAPAPRPTPTAAPPAASPAASPAPAATRLAAGRFQGIDHRASGTAALYDVAGDLRLRFEDVSFQGTPSPSVHLVPRGQRTPGGGLRLGALKAERGSFSYAAPPSYRQGAWTVLVWCDRYDVPIAAADLS